MLLVEFQHSLRCFLIDRVNFMLRFTAISPTTTSLAIDPPSMDSVSAPLDVAHKPLRGLLNGIDSLDVPLPASRRRLPLLFDFYWRVVGRGNLLLLDCESLRRIRSSASLV